MSESQTMFSECDQSPTIEACCADLIYGLPKAPEINVAVSEDEVGWTGGTLVNDLGDRQVSTMDQGFRTLRNQK
jgi:hypothetical protein